VKSALLVVVAVLGACSDGDRAALPPGGRDAGRATQRVIEPSPGTVRPLPPYAIDAGGVGPYRLGAKRRQIAALLSIPRVAILDIRGVVDASVIRAEDDEILIGGRRAEATSFEAASFIAVLTKEIGGTEGGVTVGSRRAALDALGAPVVDPAVARDPDIDIRAGLPGAWFLMRDGQVRAILLHATEASTTAPGARDAGVGADAGTEAGGDGCAPIELRAVADLAPAAQIGAPRRVVAGCFSGGAGQALVVGAEAIAVLDVGDARPRRLASLELDGLVWAAPLRVEPGRDDVVAITQRLTADELIVSLVALRLEGGRLVRVADDAVYRLSRNEGQWIGASLADLRLFVTVEARSDGFGVGGALVHGGQGPIRELAPLLPVTVSRRRRGGAEPAAATAIDAGPRDAGAPDAGVADAGARKPGN
jgi:hypothetical protein